MTLQKLAEARMIRGKLNHPDQNWDAMDNDILMFEAREELADCYNYFHKHPYKWLAYPLLKILWRLTKLIRA